MRRSKRPHTWYPRDGRRRGAGWAAVDAHRDGDRLVLEVSGDGGPPAEVVHLEDRVGAVGGRLRLERRAEASPACGRSCHACSHRGR